MRRINTHRTTNRASAVLIIGLLAAATASGPSAQEARFIEARFGIEALSADQRKELWTDVSMYAQFDAFLNSCRAPSNIETRIAAAVSRCVTTTALEQVRQRFREERSKKASTYIKEYCEHAKTRELMGRIRKAIDQVVARAAAACRACVIC